MVRTHLMILLGQHNYPLDQSSISRALEKTVLITQTSTRINYRVSTGITLRDIGPKFGYSTTDNGFIILKDVRIPRENMLMRFSKVLPDGTFVAPENERLVYIPMTAFRFIIIQRSARTLAKAATVVTRYSAVRRQSELRSG